MRQALGIHYWAVETSSPDLKGPFGGEGQRNAVVIRGGIKRYDWEHGGRERKGLQSSGGTHRAAAASGKKKAKNKIYTPPPPLSLLRLSQLGISFAGGPTNHELEPEPWSQATVSWRREVWAGESASPAQATPSLRLGPRPPRPAASAWSSRPAVFGAEYCPKSQKPKI